MRWMNSVARRVYSVPGPNSLWHIDRPHALIRWHFVVHGGIDGFSRLIGEVTLQVFQFITNV